MKQGYIKVLLMIEAIVCMIIVTTQVSTSIVFASIILFPFDQIGTILRALSLSGTKGNIISILLFIGLSLIPCGILWIRKRKGLYNEDYLLPFISFCLLFVLYFMVNPNEINFIPISSSAGLLVSKMLLVGMLDSLIICYIVLKTLRLFTNGDLDQLRKYTVVILWLFDAAFVFMIFGVKVNELIMSINDLTYSNPGLNQGLSINYMFIMLRYIVEVIPFIFNMMVIFAGVVMLNEMAMDSDSAKVCEASKKCAAVCCRALKITICSSTGFYLLQLLCSKLLLNVNGQINIPLSSIFFVLIILLLSRLVSENQLLKADNASII